MKIKGRSVQLLWFLLLTLPLLSSCAQLAPKLVGEPVSPDFSQELISEWQTLTAKNSSLSGLAKFEMVTPERTLKGTQVLILKQPDSLRAEVLSLFGSPLLLLAANGEQLGVHLPFENEFYTGEASAKNLGRFVRLPMHLQDLVNVLLYRPPMIAASSMEGYALQGQGWLLERNKPPYRQELFFDEQKRLVEVNYYNRSGLSLAIDYDGFSEEGLFPQEFDLKFPRMEITASLKFSELEVNGELSQDLFHLPIPTGAEVFSLEEQ